MILRGGRDGCFRRSLLASLSLLWSLITDLWYYEVAEMVTLLQTTKPQSISHMFLPTNAQGLLLQSATADKGWDFPADKEWCPYNCGVGLLCVGGGVHGEGQG